MDCLSLLHGRGTGAGIGNATLGDYSQLNDNRDENYKLLFVLPKGLSQDTCSSRLTMAFLLSQEQKLQAEWVKEEDCLVGTPKKGNIFVLDPFEGEVFEYLKDLFYRSYEFMIIGPQCIRQTVERKEPDATITHVGHPMFTLGMKHLIITLTKFRDEEQKNKAIKLIQLMGGFYTSTYTRAVTHVVAENVLTTKCFTAFRMDTPVMKPDWVEAVWSESLNDVAVATDPHFTTYRCPIFYNLTFCFSQLDSKTKQSLTRLIEAGGGNASSQLMKNKTSILVTPQAAADKFRYAKQWRIPCVRPEWVTDSKIKGYVLPLDTYKVNLSEENLMSTQMESKKGVPRGEVSASLISSDTSHVLVDTSHFTNNDLSVSVQAPAAPSVCNGVDLESIKKGQSHLDLEAQRSTGDDNNDVDDLSVNVQAPAAPSFCNEFDLETIKKGQLHLEAQSSTGDDNDDVDATAITEGSTDTAKVFSDIYFNIVLKNSEESSKVQTCIEELGGIMVVKTPEIVILPPVYAAERRFEAQVYTKFWVYDCQLAKSPNINLEFYHIPVKAFNGMTKIMTDVVIAVSGYSAFQKEYIGDLVTAMGGRFQDVFARKTSKGFFQSTHLICSILDNDKYRAAIKWDVPVIRHEWVFDSFKKRKIQDISMYRAEQTIESKCSNSILTETPKSRGLANRAVGVENGLSIYPATSKAAEKFKVPTELAQQFRTPKRGSPSNDDELTPVIPSQLLRMSNGNVEAGRSGQRQTNSSEPSPYFKYMSAAASRQLKMALDSAASDSPGPDYSSMKIKFPPRKSTPEADAFRNLWQAMKDKYPGTNETEDVSPN